MIAIIGAGPGGLMLARMLTLDNIPCQILEADPTPTARWQGGLLNINDGSGMNAICAAGLSDQVQAAAFRDGDAVRIVSRNAKILLDVPGNGTRPEVERSVLRQILLDSLPPDIIKWDHKVASISVGESGHQVHCVNGATIEATLLVGADGAWSKVRPLLTPVVPAYTGVTFIELHFSELSVKCPITDRIVGNGMLFCPNETVALVGHRHQDDSAELSLVVQTSHKLDVAALDRRILKSKIKDWHPDFSTLIDECDSWTVRPLYALPVGTSWQSKPTVTLLGDAAHLMSPFAGEGVNLALTDGHALAMAIRQEPDMASAIAMYEQQMYATSEEPARSAKESLDLFLAPGGLESYVELFSTRFK